VVCPRAEPISRAAEIAAVRWLYSLVAILAIVVISYSAYKLKYPDYRYRYRLALSVEAGGRTFSGSSVTEVIWRGAPNIEARGAYSAGGSVWGQAPLIDLGEHGLIVVALVSPFGVYASERGVSALFICARAFGNDSSIPKLPELPSLTGRRDLVPGNWPYLVWLPDRSDPKSARPLHPSEIDRIVPGARFATAFVEITGDPVVVDITRRLPWYEAWAGRYRQQGLVVSRLGETILSPYMLAGDAS
jgi:hypothetical protein